MFLNEDNSENKSVVHIDAETETFRPNSFYTSELFFLLNLVWKVESLLEIFAIIF